MLPLGRVCKQPLRSLTRICQNSKLYPSEYPSPTIGEDGRGGRNCARRPRRAARRAGASVLERAERAKRAERENPKLPVAPVGSVGPVGIEGLKAPNAIKALKALKAPKHKNPFRNSRKGFLCIRKKRLLPNHYLLFTIYYLLITNYYFISATPIADDRRVCPAPTGFRRWGWGPHR